MYCYRLERVQSGYCSALVTVSPIGLHEPRVSFEPLRPSLIAVNPAKAGSSFFSSKKLSNPLHSGRKSPAFLNL